ncbi:MAG TPA: DUF4127 family protein [Bacillota bacterium]|nr:DUF4127 family protein [Bacillota bacterium]
MNNHFRNMIALVLCAIMVLSSCGIETIVDVTNNAAASEYNLTKIAYVPLDNRPCNNDRMILAAKAAGFEFLIPDEDLFATVFDGQPKNSNGTQYGDRKALIDWVWAQDKAGCDYYIISFDQIMSGGLVQSRIMNNTDLTEEYAIIDSLTELAKTNRVIILSTIMRLASCTPGYNGDTIDEYDVMYQYSLVARPALSGSELTIDNIVNNFKNKSDGTKITANDLSAYGGNLTDDIIDSVVSVHERKLRMLYNMIQEGTNDNLYYYIGIDDASNNGSIQTSEIALIKSAISDNATVFAGTDELAIMALAKLNSEKYSAATTANVFYYGGRENDIADYFDVNTLKENLVYHLSSAGCTVVSDSSGKVDILILTQPLRSDEKSQYITDLINKAIYNTENNIPTIIIDSSTGTNDGSQEFGLSLVSKVNMAEIIGYSNWNTAGNRIGFAVGFGLARYYYLKNEVNPTASVSEGFLEYTTFQYIKDLAYCCTGRNYMSNYVSNYGSSSNFYASVTDSQIITINNALEKAVMDGTGGASGTNVIANLNSGTYISSLYDKYTEVSVKSFGEISVSDFNFPCYRTFEMTFDVNVVLNGVLR